MEAPPALRFLARQLPGVERHRLHRIAPDEPKEARGPRPLRQNPRPPAGDRIRSRCRPDGQAPARAPFALDARVRDSSHTQVNGSRSLAYAGSALCALLVAAMLVPGYTNGSNGW